MNLHFFSTILEKTVANQLCDLLPNSFFCDVFFNENLSKSCFGVPEDLIVSDEGLVSFLVLSDLDTIDHHYSLQRLEN